MRHFAFLITATAFATVFIAVVVASVTLTNNTRQSAQPVASFLVN